MCGKEEREVIVWWEGLEKREHKMQIFECMTRN